MHDPAGRDAVILKQSLTVTQNLEAATEVICSRTSSQLQYLRQIYHSKFGVYLEHEIERNTSGDHKKVMFLFLLAFMKDDLITLRFLYVPETFIIIFVYWL